MPSARLAGLSDLNSILELFRVAEVSDTAQPREEVEQTWTSMLDHEGVTVFVSELEGKIVSTCMLVTAPNLLRAGRGHGFLENVVTHPDYRGRGYGTTVVKAALAKAWAENCHHVLLQSGRADPQVHRFYEHCNFEPGIRTGYVAHRPDGAN